VGQRWSHLDENGNPFAGYFTSIFRENIFTFSFFGRVSSFYVCMQEAEKSTSAMSFFRAWPEKDVDSKPKCQNTMGRPLISGNQ
jgi:hypothetical protein